jgi:hypothetical protein
VLSPGNVRFPGQSGHFAGSVIGLKMTNSGHSGPSYSITSAALAKVDGGKVRPSVLAIYGIDNYLDRSRLLDGQAGGLEDKSKLDGQADQRAVNAEIEVRLVDAVAEVDVRRSAR